MPSYRDQIPDDVFKVNLLIMSDEDDDAGSGFSFQEQEQVKVGPAATQQGECACSTAVLRESRSVRALVIFLKKRQHHRDNTS